MRFVLLAFLTLITTATAADYVTVKTKDGRSLTGYYDAEEGTLTTVKPKATLKIRADDIASITPVASPEAAAVKEGTVDIVQQLKARAAEMEADRDKALATAKRYRTLATDARDPADAKKLEANANSSDAEAQGYQVRLEEISAKLGQLDKDKADQQPVQSKPRISEIAQMRLKVEEAYDRIERARTEHEELRIKLNRMISEANRAFIMNGDLESMPVRTSASPTKEENDKAGRIAAFNRQLESLRGIREKWKTTGADRRNDGMLTTDLFQGQFQDGTSNESFWQSYSEFKGKPAPY